MPKHIAPFLMSVGDQYGRAEEAMNVYVSLFDDSRVLEVEHYADDEQDTGVKQARFLLAGREYRAMDSGHAHAFTFTPAISLFVDLDDEAQLGPVQVGLEAVEVLVDSREREAPFVAADDEEGLGFALRQSFDGFA